MLSLDAGKVGGGGGNGASAVRVDVRGCCACRVLNSRDMAHSLQDGQGREGQSGRMVLVGER